MDAEREDKKVQCDDKNRGWDAVSRMIRGGRRVTKGGNGRRTCTQEVQIQQQAAEAATILNKPPHLPPSPSKQALPCHRRPARASRMPSVCPRA